MEFGFTPEEEAFREEVRSFLDKELPSDQVMPIINPAEDPFLDDLMDLNRIMARKLAKKGWLTLFWPKEYGGKESSLILRAILSEEMRSRGAPGLSSSGVAMLAPTIMRFGTEQQKKQHLPPIAKGEVFWCQGFSEPEAGCDLASLQTTAKEDGDSYVLNGQKIWTTGAHASDWCFLLARTDPSAPKKHLGITFFLLDMVTPGVNVRRIKDMGGGDCLCEVFLDEVRVPRENILGEKNRGWEVAMALLDAERGLDVGAIGMIRRVLTVIMQYVKEQGMGNNPLIRNRLADIEIAIETARLLCYRALWLASRGLPSTAEVSMSKCFINKVQQQVSNSLMTVLGSYGQLRKDSKYAVLQGIVERWYIETFSFTLFGGTSEIQRNIVATRGLGLPRG